MARAGALLMALMLLRCSAPGDAEIAQGNRLATQGNLLEAADSFRAAAAKSQRARPRELLGEALHAAGKVEEARASWLEAVQLEPQASVDAQLGLARIDSERGDQDAALERLDRVLERHPQRVEARVERVIALLRRGRDPDFKAALTDAEQAQRAAPSSPDVLYAYGNACLANKRTTEARAAFQKVKGQRPLLGAWGLARVDAAESRRTDVIVHLREAGAAADAGWVKAHVREDPAFRYLWEDPDFSREF